jgi:hypothetical protein
LLSLLHAVLHYRQSQPLENNQTILIYPYQFSTILISSVHFLLANNSYSVNVDTA